MSGQITVETEQFGAAASQLHSVGDGCRVLGMQLTERQWLPSGSWESGSGGQLAVIAAEAELISGTVLTAARLANAVADHLQRARDWYEAADDAVLRAFTEVADAFVSTIVLASARLVALGAVTVMSALLSPTGIAIAASVLAGGVLLEKLDVLPSAAELQRWWENNQQHLANPLTVLLVRLGVSSGDEIANGLMNPLGDLFPHGSGAGQFNSPQEVAGVLAAGIGLAAAPMRVQRAARLSTAGTVSSVAELAATIPGITADAPHATVTKFARGNGASVYLVSVGGTRSAQFGGENGMDNLSNLSAYAGADAQALAAVREAMGEAGIREGDEVVFAGYSQGALIVAQLAKSGDWQTQSVLLVGSPIHGNAIEQGIPVTQLEHDGDLITGLQGLTCGPQDAVTVVRRNPIAEGSPPDGGILAQHALSGYLQTAQGYDQLLDPHTVEQRERLLAPLAGAIPLDTTDFRFVRAAFESETSASAGAQPRGSR